MSKTINAGRVTFVPKDNFSNNIRYKKFDIVTYNGSSYFAKKDTIGHTPTEEEFWQLVAEKGQNGEPGAVKMQVVDTLPETGETDTIYLVKKDNPGKQNLYDEYVYTDTGWEHIGDTSVDLSNYYTKTEVKQITGELTDLSTENKSNLVNAINEVASNSGESYTAGTNITINDNVINCDIPYLENITIHSLAIGKSAQTIYRNSIAIGYNANAKGTNQIMIGSSLSNINKATIYTSNGVKDLATEEYVDDQVGNINTVLATLTTVSEVTK